MSYGTRLFQGITLKGCGISNLVIVNAAGNTNEISIAGWALGDKKES